MHRRPTDGRPSVGRVYLLLAGVFGVAIVAVTPPMQVPDETAHFLRAAAVARGQVVPGPTAAGPGGTLPSSLVDLTAGPWGVLRGRPEASIKVREVTSRLTHRPRVEAEVIVPFPESSRWSPVATLPQSLALLLARALGLPPLVHYLLGRLAGLAAWTALVWLSLRVAPGCRWTLALLALTPMSLFLAGSHSPDVMTNALALLLVALALRSTASLDPLGGREAVFLLTTAGLLMLTKPYLPLLLLLWMVPRARLGGRPRTTAWRLGAPLLCLLPAALWHLASAGASPPLPLGAEPFSQLAWLIQHPVEAVAVLVRSTLQQSLTWAHQFIGVLGWLDSRLPRPLVLTEALLLLAVPLVDRTGGAHLTPRRRVLLGGVFVVTAFALVLQAYLRWMPVGAAEVRGLQGRYFIPIAPLALLPIAGLAGDRVRAWWLPAACVLQGAILAWTVWALAARYYG